MAKSVAPPSSARVTAPDCGGATGSNSNRADLITVLGAPGEEVEVIIEPPPVA